MSYRFPWIIAGVTGALAAGCAGGRRPPAVTAPTTLQFTRITQEAGLHFRHDDGNSGKKYFPEVMGPGCAFVDLTGDGLPDIFLVNGTRLPGAPPGPRSHAQFYINRGSGRFEDATATSGLGDSGYGIGCCVGDYDNDGRPDLYVTHLGTNTLYHNDGNGHFSVAVRAGVSAGGFSSGAAFADYDGDGWLDLYVSRYIRWSPEKNVVCTDFDGQQRVPVYCRPNVYAAETGILYHNNRDGTFTDVTRRAGLTPPPGRGLGCIWTDVNGDGAPDLYVANDMSSNFLFINDGRGHFREEGLPRGVAVGDNGRPQASMGVCAVDYDGDGHMDLAVTNFSGEYLALYHNLGDGHFEDASARTGLVEATSPYVGFGLGFPDWDLDGTPDLFIANGHVTEAAERFYPGVTFKQPRLWLLGQAAGGFRPVVPGGAGVSEPRVGRGAAFADLENDGDLDVLVSNWRDEPDLLRNDSPAAGHWIRFRLQGTRCNRSAIGARVEVTAGGKTRVQELYSGGSYCSQSDLKLTFGLGAASAAEEVKVRWPGGETQTWQKLAAGQEHRLIQK